MDLSTSLEDEKNRSAFLEVSLENEKEKNDESAKTEKLVAQQLKGALDVVQVLTGFCLMWESFVVVCDPSESSVSFLASPTQVLCGHCNIFSIYNLRQI